MNESLKIQPHHLERGAYPYVRQSSIRQVVENIESTKRQYALRGRATALGWRDDQIIVIDSDRSESGASAVWREGLPSRVATILACPYRDKTRENATKGDTLRNALATIECTVARAFELLACSPGPSGQNLFCSFE